MSSNTARPVALTAAFGVWMISFTQFGGSAVTSAILALQMAFADMPAWVASLISTMPSLTTLVGCLLFASIAGKKVSMKTIAIVSLAIYTIFGCLPAFWNDNIVVILIARGLTGLGIGFIMPLGATWFLRMIRNNDQRGFYLSWNIAIGSVGCIIMTILGGVLCDISWNYTFLAYLCVLVSLVCVIIFFKEPKSVEELIREEGASEAEFEAAKRAKLTGPAWFIVLIYFVFQLCVCLTLNMGAVVMDTNLGLMGGAFALIGTLISLYTVGTAVASVFGGFFIRTLGKWCTPVFIVITAIGVLVVANGNSIPMFAVGYFIVGFGSSMHAYVNFEIGLVTKVAGLAWAASMLMFATNLGNFGSSFFQGILQGILPMDLGIAGPLYVAAALLVVSAVAFLIYAGASKQRAAGLAQAPAGMPGPGAPAPEADAE